MWHFLNVIGLGVMDQYTFDGNDFCAGAKNYSTSFSLGLKLCSPLAYTLGEKSDNYVLLCLY